MPRSLLHLAQFALVAGALWGCKGDDSGAIRIITDDEAGTFSRAPAPTQLQIVAVESADASTVLATATLPTDTIDLGQLNENSPNVSINVRGVDGAGTLRVFGATLPINYAGMVGQTLPVFVQRSGEFARLPGPLSDARNAPALGVLQGEYLLVAGGSDTATASATQLFDFGVFEGVPTPPSLPVVPQSLAFYGTIAWLVNAAGGTYYDFSTSGSLAITTPAGGTFADVAGGATLSDSTGAQYIVGGTRTTGAPTNSVLKIDPSDSSDSNYPYGKPSWIALTAARLGASAAWVEGRGLVVTGGVGAGGGAPSEIVAPGTVLGTALPYALGDSTGAGAAALDARHVILAGGLTAASVDPGVRVVDLGCAPSAAASCVAPWPALAVPLASAQAFAWTATDALVVGNAAGTGDTHVFRVTATTATEVPTRVPHKNARAAWSPVGSIVVFGGSNVLESFTP